MIFKIIKILYFFVIFARKINKIAEFYMIIALEIFSRFYVGEGCPRVNPSPTALILFGVTDLT